jgi:polysaccharide export outer membrane protein
MVLFGFGMTAGLFVVAAQPATKRSAARRAQPDYGARYAVASTPVTVTQGQLPLQGGPIELCQALSPAAPNPVTGVDCVANGGCGENGWDAMGPIDWQQYAQGEYVGHARLAHVPEYRLRVDDQLDVVYRLTREETARPYQLNVGDEIEVESFTDEKLNRKLLIQPDGTITLRLLGQVPATRRSVAQLQTELEDLYKKYYKTPAITVTPVRVNTKLQDILNTVDATQGFGGQQFRESRVTPEGTIQLPAIGSVPAQGLTLDELRQEVEERYSQIVDGLGVTPVLRQRAPRYCYVLGEVKKPGRYTLEAPTTAMMAITLAEGWNVGANVRQVVVFRRGDDWRLIATMLDLRAPLYGKTPCPADEIWLNDSDIVVVPKSPILVLDNFIELVFIRGIYGVVPFNLSYNFTNFGSFVN